MRFNTKLILVETLLFIFISSCFRSDTNKEYSMLNLAQIPHMGWNSYTSFGIDINTAKVMRAADVIVASGMADAGYEYIVVDDGWQMARDANGKIVAGFIRFLKGIKHLEDYVQSKALKFGICTDTGTETCRSLPGK